MADKPRTIPVTEQRREERANWRALCEAGYVPPEVYVAKFSAKPPVERESDDEH